MSFPLKQEGINFLPHKSFNPLSLKRNKAAIRALITAVSIMFVSLVRRISKKIIEKRMSSKSVYSRARFVQMYTLVQANDEVVVKNSY